MLQFASIGEWFLGIILILASLGVILSKKPVHACLFFLLTLFCLAALFIQLSAEFIAVMQVLVYAGAILVIFMFVIVLFQDAHQQIVNYTSQCTPGFLMGAAFALLLAFGFIGEKLFNLPPSNKTVPADFGTVQELGKTLYINFFFPFEAVTLLFLIAVIGALYIGRKGEAQK